MTCIGSEELFKQSRKLLFCVVQEALGDYVVFCVVHEPSSDRFQLLLDVPGVEPREVEITLDNGVLSVSGIRTEENFVEAKRPE